MAARHLLNLAHDAFPGAHVVVVHVLRSGHRRIGEPQRVGVELVAAGEPEAVRLLFERDRVLLSAFDVAHHDPGQGVLALQPHEPPGVHIEARDQDAGAVWYEIDPVRAARRCDRRLDDLEVLGAAGVGEDNQPVFVVGDVVLGIRVPLRDHDRGDVGPFRVDEPHLARDVVVRVDYHEPA